MFDGHRRRPPANDAICLLADDRLESGPADEVGRAYTLVDANELTPEAIVDAIRAGDVEARIDKRWFHEAVQRLYHEIHGRKGWLEDDPAQTPGVGAPPGEETDH